MAKLALERIDADFAVMVRDGTDWDTVQRYAEILEQLPPITVFKSDGHYLLADGFHRYSAALQRDWKEIEADIKEGSRETALEYAITANLLHGRPFTPLEYKKATQRLGWLYGLKSETHDDGISFMPHGIIERISRTLNRSATFADTVFRADTVRQHVPSHLSLSDSALQAISRAPQNAWRPLAEAAYYKRWRVEDIQEKVREIKTGESVADVIADTSKAQGVGFPDSRLTPPTIHHEIRQAIREDPQLREELLAELRGGPFQPAQEISAEPSNEVETAELVEEEVEEDRLDDDVAGELVKDFDQQIRNILNQVPDKSARVADIIQEELTDLRKRLDMYPQNTKRMESKFKQLRMLEERGVIPYTIWDFPFRDDYAGDKEFHGNSSPQIVEQCIWRLTEEGDFVVDPMAGSGTTIDVCNKYNRHVQGYDLNPFREDIIKADARNLPLENNSVDMVFIHPPYWDMVRYSNGNDDAGDLSRAKTLDEFASMLRDVFRECKRILKPEKFVCVLLGDLVKEGQFQPLCRIAANILEESGMVDYGHAVKLAHGDTSRSKSGVIVAEFIATSNLKISHDLVLFFRKGGAQDGGIQT